MGTTTSDCGAESSLRIVVKMVVGAVIAAALGLVSVTERERRGDRGKWETKSAAKKPRVDVNMMVKMFDTCRHDRDDYVDDDGNL